MFKTLLLFLIGLSAFQTVCAQTERENDTLSYYFKNNGKAAAKDSADFSLQILPKQQASKKKLYPVIEHYANGKIKLEALSSVHALNLILEGPATIFYPNGKINRAANYKDGRLQGVVTDYFANGNKAKVTNYANGALIGVVSVYYPNGKLYALTELNSRGNLEFIECRDSLGNISAEKGEGKWLDFDESLAGWPREADVHNRKITGKWIAKIDTTQYMAQDKNEPAAMIAAVYPKYKYRFSEVEEIFSRNLVYPPTDKSKKNRQEQVVVSLVVEKDGTLTHLKAIKSPSPELANEVLRVMALTSPWLPGSLTVGGPPSRVQSGLIIDIAVTNRSNGGKDFDVYIDDNGGLPVNQYLTQQTVIPDSVYNKTGEVFQAINLDKQANFPGGQELFFKFLYGAINYPMYEMEKGISGNVIIQFVIEKDGVVSNIQGLRSPSEGLTNEAKRIMKLSPAWAPGEKNGAAVRTSLTMPIIFHLDDTSKIFQEVQIMPQFPGGMDAFVRFLAINIKYPRKDRELGISGKVVVQFVIEKNGSITNIRPVTGPSKTLINEAIRVIEMSPKWSPGEHNNRPVRVNYTVPINFAFDAPEKQPLNIP